MKKNLLFNLCFCFILTQAVGANTWALSSKSLDLNVTAETSLTYDDNVTYLKDNKIDDTIGKIGLGIQVDFKGKKNILNLNAKLIQEFFSLNSDFNNFSSELSLDHRIQLTPYDQILIYEKFIQADEPRSFQDAVGRTGGRYDYLINNIILEYKREISKQLFCSVSYFNDYFYPDSGDIVGSARNDSKIEMSYTFNSNLMMLAGYNFDDVDYDPGSDGITFHTGFMGLRLTLLDKIHLLTKIGYDHIEWSQDDLNKPQFVFQLSDALEDTTDFAFLFTKKYGSNFYQEDIFDHWQLSFSVGKQIYQRAKLSSEIFYGEGTFLDADDDKTFFGAKTGFEFELKEDFDLQVTYSFSNFRSSSDSDEYKKNFIQCALSWTF